MIKLYWIGKTKNKQIKELVDYYLKLASKFQPLKVVVLPKAKKSFSKSQIQELEAKTVLSKFADSSINILLDETGSKLSSPEFADFLQKKSNKDLNFFIGGSFGFAPFLKEKADLLLSFSDMTFTHDMIRALLCEQIYRAFTITAGKEYHY